MPPKKPAPAAKAKAPAKPAAKAAAKPAAKAAAKPAGKAAPAKKAAAGGAAAAAAPPPPAEPVPMGETIGLKAMARCLFEDPANELAKSGRWPVLCDESERATTFLRYRDCNMLNVMNEPDMTTERIRMALLGGLRFGKPMVIDMMTSDVRLLYPKLVAAVEAVKPGLMKEIISKEIVKEECYKQIIKETDDDYRQLHLYDDRFLDNFRFVIACGSKDFPPEVIANFYIVTIE